MSRWRAALLALTVLLVPLSGRAEVPRVMTVHFPPGSETTEVTGRVAGREMASYRVGAEAGQRLGVTLDPTNGATYFNVYAPGSRPGDAALAASGLTGPMVPDLNRFDGVLPASGNYTVTVYMMRSAARRGEVSDFRLRLRLSGALADVPANDFADGLAGGPDAWRVTAGRLNLRAAPSAGARVLAQAGRGDILRNFGCRMAEGRRWCRVDRPDGTAGWAAGAYLAEATGR